MAPQADLTPAMQGLFRFPTADHVLHGPDTSRSLATTVHMVGGSRALVLTGTTIAEKTELLWYIEQVLGQFHAASYTGVRPHTPAPTVDEAAELFRAANADVLVSLGGGSVIDTAKAVAHAVAQERGSAPPHIALPTTLSAAEFTGYAGVTEPEAGIKRRVAGEGLLPRAVILDPRITLVTPPQLWLSSGIKALDHALESLLNPRNHPLIDTLTVQAVHYLRTALPACHADPTDVEARGRAQLGAWMSLFSPGTVRGGLSHAIGHQLGARGVPHGVTSCITLAPVLSWLAPVTDERQDALADTFGVPTLPLLVSGLVESLDLPSRLRDTDLERAALPEVAAAAFPEARTAGPRPIDDETTLLALLDAMW